MFIVCCGCQGSHQQKNQQGQENDHPDRKRLHCRRVALHCSVCLIVSGLMSSDLTAKRKQVSRCKKLRGNDPKSVALFMLVQPRPSLLLYITYVKKYGALTNNHHCQCHVSAVLHLQLTRATCSRYHRCSPGCRLRTPRPSERQQQKQQRQKLRNPVPQR